MLQQGLFFREKNMRSKGQLPVPKLFFLGLLLTGLLLTSLLVACGKHPVNIENRTADANVMAFHWGVSLEEAAKGQSIFPELGGVLFTTEYDNAQYLDVWVAVYQNQPKKLQNAIDAYGEPAYIIVGTDEANLDDHTPYLTPQAFAAQLQQAVNDLTELGLEHIPLVSAGLAPKTGDFDWIYWYEVEKHFDTKLLTGVAYNANKTSLFYIERFIDYFTKESKSVVLQPAPFNDSLNRGTSGSEHIYTFFRLSQRPEVLSVNVWNLYDTTGKQSKGFLDRLGSLLYTGVEFQRFYVLEVQNRP